MKETKYFEIEDLLKEATASVQMIEEKLELEDKYGDEGWSEELTEVRKHLDCLLESMIFTFVIEAEEKEEPDK